MEGFGRRLENLRDKAGYDKKDMSKILNFSKNVYGRYEREEVKPSLETAARLAIFFNVSLDYLVYGDGYGSDKYKSFDKIMHIFQESGITDPYISQSAKWEILNDKDLKRLQKHFELVVHQAKMRT